MKALKRESRTSFMRLARLAATCFSLAALLSGTFVPPASTQARQKQRLSEDQRILHALNRLGFGARPGDVERVRAIGLENYIAQQLEPSKIADAVAEAKVRDLTTLSLSTAELYERFPQPGRLLRQLERQGALPPELARVRDSRVKGAGTANTAKASQAGPEGAAGSMMQGSDEAASPQNEASRAENNQEYRRAVREYMLKNGLERPQRIIAELQASRILRAVYSKRQLQEVMVDFWSNHFNIYAAKGADRWLLTAYDRDTIRPHTMGKFSELLRATAESPAMLFYLDNFQSASPNARPARAGARPQGRFRDIFGQLMRMEGARARRGAVNPNARGGEQQQQPGTTTTTESAAQRNEQQARPQQQRRRRGINENYARELMELHTLGVDGGYTQKDVQEVARCFTGWTIFAPRGLRNMERGDTLEPGQFYFNPRLHDDGEKTVLGHKIPAGGGVRDGLMVLDILARHPSTARFIAKKLARRFITDEPGPQLIDRIAAAFTKSDGSIRETLRAVFASPEFNSAEAYRAKIKTPFELAVSSIRTLGGETNGGPAIHQWISRMGEPLYGHQAPTGYPDKAENWVNTGALLERLNFGLVLASNRIPGTRVDLQRFHAGAGNSASDRAQMMNRFLEVIVRGETSPNTKAILLKQLSEPMPSPAISNAEINDEAEALGQRPARVRRRARQELARADLSSVSNPELVKVVGLILGSPEFQRQ